MYLSCILLTPYESLICICMTDDAVQAPTTTKRDVLNASRVLLGGIHQPQVQRVHRHAQLVRVAAITV